MDQNQKRLNSAWKDPKSVPSFGVDVPDGVYHCEVAEANLQDSQAGNFGCLWVMEILDGDFAGQKIRKWSKICATEKQTLEEAIGWFKSDLGRFGVELPDSFDGVPALLDGLVGTKIDVKVQTKNDSTWYYFQKPRGGGAAAAPKGRKAAVRPPAQPEEEEPAEEAAPPAPAPARSARPVQRAANPATRKGW